MPTLSLVKRSPVILYGLVAGLLLGALGIAGNVDSSYFQQYYILVQVLALGMGCLHLWLGNRFAPDLFTSFGRSVLATCLILLLAVVVVLVICWQTGYLADRWPFATSLIPFVIPLLVQQAYQYYLNIPPADYRKWYYPVNGDMPDLDLLDLTKILVIQFEFLKTPTDTNFTNFKAKAPISMTLGDLFLIFINDYNERTPASPIQYTDAAGRPFGWVFSRKTTWWQRPVYCDPALDFTLNRLSDNDTIVARRT
ncbi:TssN family type VI secretion system protein [Spirosoma utsteinense]|uniref:Uncharacterized protein n=1 Tax=Spirosoma utsteinense TaxID=2585773 RepID=A0ABR6WCA7_9BACT|nr:TssN family type VI secretion system protein [Spirosoma utsteinense]MBC3788299.1 hypothetical protein [Spirosoma utsteinense]MBC3794205.1 hypothetical protein [Spirosoma utsteinense]